MNLDQLRTQAFCERSTPADQRRMYQGTSCSPTSQVPKASALAKPPSSVPHGSVALIASGSEPCSQVFASLRSPASRVEITARSEEHTSELQSPCNLVCRLLLEKKKKEHRLI